MAAGHRPAAQGLQRFSVALEGDGLAAVDEVEPLRLVLRTGTVEEAPFDRLDPRAAGPDVGVRQEDLPPHVEDGLAQQRSGEHAVAFEAVDHLLPGLLGPGRERRPVRRVR